MHSHIIVKGRLARVLFFKKTASHWQCGWMRLCNENEMAFILHCPWFALSLDKIGCTSAMKMKWLSFCIALGLHYLCKEGKKY